LNMVFFNILRASALILVFSFFTFNTAWADIYRYVDKNGVWHFTNVNTDKRYRIFAKSRRKNSTKFLTDYGDIIRQASRRFNVDPHFIRAIVKVESAFDHRAVSSAGAKGLMQLMPETADEMKVKGTRSRAYLRGHFNLGRKLNIVFEAERNFIPVVVTGSLINRIFVPVEFSDLAKVQVWTFRS